jgi:DNA polymerase-3 subunit beta
MTMTAPRTTTEPTGTMILDIKALRRFVPPLRKAWAKRPAVPILACAKFEGGTISLFDFETSVTATVGTGDLHAAVRFQDILDVLKTLPRSGEVLMTVDNGNVKVGAFTLKAECLDDFPALPVMPERKVAYLNTVSLDRIARVAVACSTDNPVPALRGISLTVTDENLTVAATDRYRLHVSENVGEAYEDCSLHLHPSALTACAKLGEVRLWADDNADYYMVAGDGFTITGRQLSAEMFPAWKRLIPEPDVNAQTEIDTAPFLNALKGATQKGVIRLSPHDDGLHVEQGTDTLYDAPTGVQSHLADMMAFSPDFLRDALTAIGPKCTFQASDVRRPALFLTAGMIVLLMPVREQS